MSQTILWKAYQMLDKEPLSDSQREYCKTYLLDKYYSRFYNCHSAKGLVRRVCGSMRATVERRQRALGSALGLVAIGIV